MLRRFSALLAATFAVAAVLLPATAEAGGGSRLRIKSSTVVSGLVSLPACTTTVTNTSTFNTAVTAAATNAVICLDNGTYSRMDVSGAKTNVTIRPTNGCSYTTTQGATGLIQVVVAAPITIAGLQVAGGSGWRIKCFKFTPDYTLTKKVAWVRSTSSDIVISYNAFTGPSGSDPVENEDGGFNTTGGSAVEFSHNSMRRVFGAAVGGVYTTSLTVDSNLVDDNFGDAMQFYETDVLNVTNNKIYNFNSPGITDHPDGIQVFTLPSEADPTGAHDFTFSGNLICRGVTTGFAYNPQGIFIGNERSNTGTASIATSGVMTVTAATGSPDQGWGIHVGDIVICASCGAGTTTVTSILTGTGWIGTYQTSLTGVTVGSGAFAWGIPYKNVTITGNFVYGAQNNGIFCGTICDTLVMTGNTVIEMTGENSDLFYGAVWNSTVTGNTHTGINTYGTNLGTFTPNTSTSALAPSTSCPPV